MSNFFQGVMVWVAAVMLATTVHAQQLTNADFEDWSGTAFNGEAQPKGWNASHVEQVGMKFNFAHIFNTCGRQRLKQWDYSQKKQLSQVKEPKMLNAFFN